MNLIIVNDLLLYHQSVRCHSQECYLPKCCPTIPVSLNTTPFICQTAPYLSCKVSCTIHDDRQPMSDMLPDDIFHIPLSQPIAINFAALHAHQINLGHARGIRSGMLRELGKGSQSGNRHKNGSSHRLLSLYGYGCVMTSQVVDNELHALVHQMPAAQRTIRGD